MHYVLWTATGLVAGWVAGLVVRGRGYGLVGDLILGSVGGVVGGHLFNALGATSQSTKGARRADGLDRRRGHLRWNLRDRRSDRPDGLVVLDDDSKVLAFPARARLPLQRELDPRTNRPLRH